MDWWRILSPKGEELARRVLLHPHENEQPFTRSLGGVFIPPELNSVTVEAHDTVHGLGGQSMTINLLTGETTALTLKNGS